MIVISIMAVLLVVLATYALRARVTTADIAAPMNEQSGVLAAALDSRGQVLVLDGSLGTRNTDPRAKARRRAVRESRRVNRKKKDSARKRRRKRGTGAKRKHGRSRGR